MSHMLTQQSVIFKVYSRDISDQNDSIHAPNYYHILDCHLQSIMDQIIHLGYLPIFYVELLLITYQLSPLML